jgi:hypothetical protein
MCRHVIGTFSPVAVVGIIFRDRLIEKHFEIFSNRRVRIFIQTKRCGGMLYKYVTDTFGYIFQFGDRMDDLSRDQMKASGFRLQCNMMLKNVHYMGDCSRTQKRQPG